MYMYACVRIGTEHVCLRTSQVEGQVLREVCVQGCSLILAYLQLMHLMQMRLLLSFFLSAELVANRRKLRHLEKQKKEEEKKFPLCCPFNFSSAESAPQSSKRDR